MTGGNRGQDSVGPERLHRLDGFAGLGPAVGAGAPRDLPSLLRHHGHVNIMIPIFIGASFQTWYGSSMLCRALCPHVGWTMA